MEIPSVKFVWLPVLAVIILVGYQEYRIRSIEQVVFTGTAAVDSRIVQVPSVEETIAFQAEGATTLTGKIESVSNGSFVISTVLPDFAAFRKRNIPGTVMPYSTRRVEVKYGPDTKIDGMKGGVFTTDDAVQVGTSESYLEDSEGKDLILVSADFIVVLPKISAE